MRLCTLLVSLVVLFGAGAPAWADHEAKTEVKTESTTHKAGDEVHGANELKVHHQFGLTRWDLGIFTLVVFVALLAILGKYAWGPMLAGLDAREAGLHKVHADAGTARDEAQKALDEIKARLAKAHEEVRAMLDEARRDGQVVKDQLKADAAADIQSERGRGLKEIEMARDQALQDIYQQSVQLASLLSTKVIKRELTPADHTRLVDEALADLKQTLSKT